MPQLINERKAIPAIGLIGAAIFIISQLKLFAAPVVVSEKALGFLLLALFLIMSGIILAAKAVRKV